MLYQRSSALFKEAKKVIPGGVNSPVRAFNAVGGTPIFAKSAKGAYVYDEDGNRFIDYINSCLLYTSDAADDLTRVDLVCSGSLA